MKTTIKKFLVVVTMLGTLLNYANEAEISFNLLEGKKVKVTFNTVIKGNTLSIKDNNGTVVYRQQIKNTGIFSRILNLSNLETGNYSAELEKDFETIVRDFTILKDKVSFKEESKVFKPVIRTKNNLLLVSQTGFNKEPMKVVIYYNEEVIFSETVQRNTKIFLNRAYRLDKEIKGDYKILVKNNNKTYLKNFTI